jgi:signal transduction histidine kinase
VDSSLSGDTNPRSGVSPTPGRNAAGRRALIDEELVDSVAWLIRLRWIASIGVIFAIWFVSLGFGLEVPMLPLMVIGVGIFLYNIVFHLIERRFKRTTAPIESYRKLAFVQVGFDWLAMILLIHFSGGIESPAIFFFIFHIIIASIFFSQVTAFAFTILAIVLLSLTAVLELFSILPHYAIGGFLNVPLYQNNLYVTAILVFFGSTGLIAAFLATSIQKRLRQHEEDIFNLTESLQSATIRLQALNNSARVLSSSLELQQVLDRLVKNTSEVMGIRACSIRLLAKSGERLEPVAVFGLSQAYLEKGPIDLENNPLAREVLAGRIVNIPDVTSTSLLQYRDWAVQEGIYAMLSAPLIGKNGPLGILRAYSDERNRFTADDEIFLTAIAAQGTIAIENALAYQAIEDLDATKSSFIRTITHELRSPVSVIRSLLRTITAGYSGRVNEQQKDIIDRAIRRVDFLQKLIDDLLDLAAGKADLKSHEATEPVPLEDILQRLVDRFTPPAKEKDQTLDWQNQADQPSMVMASPEALDRIFNNLLSNAVKYTPHAGKVTVTLSRSGVDARIVVEDTGIGIPEEAMEHLFEEFYRAPNAKEFEREGTGLGLTIVKDLVTRFGGRITVHSTPGSGTRFTVSLPLVSEKNSSPPST